MREFKSLFGTAVSADFGRNTFEPGKFEGDWRLGLSKPLADSVVHQFLCGGHPDTLLAKAVALIKLSRFEPLVCLISLAL